MVLTVELILTATRKEKVMQINLNQKANKPPVRAAKPVAKKEVKRKAVAMFTFTDHTKIDNWDRALPPQAKCIATTITKYGIQYGKPCSKDDVKQAMEKLNAAETAKRTDGKKWTKQDPYHIFAYYMKPLVDNKLLVSSK